MSVLWAPLEVSDLDRSQGFYGGLPAPDPRVFPRGHYGTVLRDPDGNPVLVWSERTADRNTR